MDTRLIIFVIVLFIILFIVKEFSGKDEDKKQEEKPKTFEKLLYKQRKLLTQAELSLFRNLEKEYGNDYYIIPQVVLSSIVDVDMPSKFYAYKGYRSKIDKKTLDFVLFDKVSFAPVLAIELDDYFHQIPKRMERDVFVDSVLDKVGIKIERVKSGESYSKVVKTS